MSRNLPSLEFLGVCALERARVHVRVRMCVFPLSQLRSEDLDYILLIEEPKVGKVGR